MKKVININFHSRVIPIEESAYEILKQYSDSLRKYFANEEGRDEIINDIESRIAELFSEVLKKGASCITDDDVTAIIASMGRPEDFDAADGDSGSSFSSQQQSTQQESQKQYSSATGTGRGRYYRNADDKILGGVCSGLANYLGIDPIILRILFVLLVAPLFWVYILLWIIVPSRSLQSNITKRLFRSADDKVIGGVSGGLGAYFNIQSWIFRAIFALPFILGIISRIFHAAFWNWDFGFFPRFISGGLGGTFILTYIILWIAVPVATSAADKLEMRGEKIDLNSIANTIKSDLGGFKGRMDKMGGELKEGAQRVSSEIRSSAEEKRKMIAAEMNSRRTYNSGLGHAIGILFKAFFLFIAGIIALVLFLVLISLLFGGIAVLPLKNFVISGFTQNTLAWASLILFLGVPLIALITWLVRRIMGARSRTHYLGYVFASLWVIGLVCTIILLGTIARGFRTRDFIEEDITITQPTSGKLTVDLMHGRAGHRYEYTHDWYGINWDNDWPLYGDNYDTMMLNTVRVNIVKSKDSSFHVHRLKFSHGATQAEARDLASRIRFDVSQDNNALLLPRAFAISTEDRFRNQQLLLVVEVPVGKKIQLDNSLSEYNWFTINVGRRRGLNIRDYDESEDNSDDWGESFRWHTNVEYVMTSTGLEKTDKLSDGEFEESPSKKSSSGNGGIYHYRGHSDSTKTITDSVKQKKKHATSPVAISLPKASSAQFAHENAEQSSSPIYLLLTIL